jgi:Flp pilus assembly protein TadD
MNIGDKVTGMLLKAAAIVLTGLYVYAPVIHGNWLWDDAEEITRNADLRDTAGLEKIWISPSGADYLPVKGTVQWLEWQRWGGNTTGYHALSIALHLLSALLICRLLQKLGIRLAWIGGLVFAVHPLAVESVAWIAELKNTLSLPFLLLAMLAYMEFDEEDKTQAYVLSLVLFLLAMLSKSSVVMFPVVILLYCWWKRGRVDRADLRASAPFFGLSLALGLVTLWFQSHRAILPGAVLTGGLFERIEGARQALMFYFRKSVFPFGLLPIYPSRAIGPPNLGAFLAWLVTGFVVVRLAVARTTAGRGLVFGLGFFTVNLLPVLGFVPMSYLDVSSVADHFAYISLVGLAGLAAAGAGAVWDAAASILPAGRIWAACGFALLLGRLAFASRIYAGNFNSEEGLWTYALARNPDSWAVHYNLATAWVQRGNISGAADQYREALRLKPDSAESSYNLATALVQIGRPEEAVGYYEQALKTLPRAQLAEAHYRIGNLVLQLGRTPEAIENYRDALAINPKFAAAESNLGSVLGETGRTAEALEHLERAAQLDPNDAGAQNNLGNALYVAGRLPEAIECYERALQLQPDYAEARTNLEMARHALAGR